jgi:hypothetical protein
MVIVDNVKVLSMKSSAYLSQGALNKRLFEPPKRAQKAGCRFDPGKQLWIGD